MKRFILSFLILVTINVNAQVTSNSFKITAKNATSEYNKNKECVNYVKTLNTFLKSNASNYKIKKYTVYLYSSKIENIFLIHDYDNGKTAISDNGKHYVMEIDGYIFDNNHPKGQLKSDWEKSLECINGVFPSGFKTRKPIINPTTLK